MSSSSSVDWSGDSSPAAESEALADLLADLDDRAAADDEHLWLSYEDAQRSEGREVDLALASVSVSGASRPASAAAARSLRALISAAAVAAPEPVTLASGRAVRARPANTRTPLTRTQLAIASELDLIDLSGADSREASAKFALIHPLWIAHGKKLAEAEQRAAALAEATRGQEVAAPVPPPASVDLDLASLTTTAPLASPSSRRSTQASGGLSSRSSSRGGSREDAVSGGDHSHRHKKGANGVAELALPPPPPRERTLALGTALVQQRCARTQSQLQESRGIPLSKVSPIPLTPDSEHFRLTLERRLLSPALTEHELTWADHSILIRELRSRASGARTTTYFFDGERYRETFEEGDETPTSLGGVLEDLAKADPLVWRRARDRLSADILAPIDLPPGRDGWRLFWTEYVSFELCAVHLPLLRTIADAEIALDEIKLNQQLQQQQQTQRQNGITASGP